MYIYRYVYITYVYVYTQYTYISTYVYKTASLKRNITKGHPCMHACMHVCKERERIVI